MIAPGTDQYCWFYDDDAFQETARPGFRRRVISGDQLQLCFWRIKGGSTGSFMHKHDDHEQLTDDFQLHVAELVRCGDAKSNDERSSDPWEYAVLITRERSKLLKAHRVAKGQHMEWALLEEVLGPRSQFSLIQGRLALAASKVSTAPSSATLLTEEPAQQSYNLRPGKASAQHAMPSLL